ncbi:MAG: sigma-70 family RNA polymerase sigma factor [Lacipirellulaceae bacterium]
MAGEDQDEFARQFLENQGRLYGYIATLLVNRNDAEDVLQRTSLILWQKWDQYDPRRGFLPWARGVALNEVRNLLRRSERRNVHLSEPVLELLASELDDETIEVRSAALAICLDKLKRASRDLLEQCYLGSGGIKAVASELGQSPAAIYMRLHRTRRQLIDCISRRVAAELE